MIVWNMVNSFIASDVLNRRQLLTQIMLIVVIGSQCLHSTFFGLFHDNIYEVYSVMLVQLFISFGVAGMLLISTPWSVYEYTLLSYGSVFFLLYSIYIYPLHAEYSWTFFQAAGADPEFRKKYRRFLRFQALLKIELFLLTLNTLLVGYLRDDITWFMVFDVAVVCAGLISYVLGRAAFEEEIAPLSFSFWVFQLLMPAYLLLTASFMKYDNITIEFDTPKEAQGFYLLYGGSAVMLFLLFIAVMISSAMLYQHFGEGLKHLDYLRKKSKGLKNTASAPASPLLRGEGTDNSVQSDSEAAQDPFQEVFQNTTWQQQHPAVDKNPLLASPSSANLYYDNYKKEHAFK
eukprot:TRINITY_DN771_c0_g1_i1.p1 TRINITY_DN771_c0_g1~~TRINITY_DN771_c0_g1_i1.p1  ORF type:complete len:346 (+),score=66.44 TRINITY_DN771_c0_g1_i1:326-1363(+)